MSEYEELMTKHHPAPWLPTAEETALYEDNQVRMACPGPGEDLFHRYRELLAGLRGIRFTDAQLLESWDFERASADLLACKECSEAIKDEEFKLGKSGISIQARHGCRSIMGGGFYYDLARKTTAREGKPHFVVCNCHGPARRLAEINAVLTGGVVYTYESEKPRVQQVLTTAKEAVS